MKKSSASLLLCLLFAGFCGCTGDSASSTTQKKAHVTIEARDENTGEQARIHKFDDQGREYETQITFTNKTSGTAIWNPDAGVIIEYKLTQLNSRTLQEHSKFSSDGKRVVWRESYNSSGKLQSRLEEKPNKDRQEDHYGPSGDKQVSLVMRADGTGEATYWLRLPEEKESSLNGRVTWEKDGSYHVESYAGQKLGGKDQLLLTADKKKDGYLIVCYYAAGGPVFLRSYWRELTDKEMKEPAMSYAGEWLLVKVEEPRYGYQTEDRVFDFDETPFQTSADKVEITDANGTKTVIYKKSGAREKTAEKVEVYDKDGKLVDTPAPTQDHSNKLHPGDPRAVQPPERLTPGWIDTLRDRFKPSPLISDLSKGN